MVNRYFGPKNKGKENADCGTVSVSADAFLYQAEPDVNYGLDDSLATDRDSRCGPEKQALLFFPLGTPEPDPASISDFVRYDDDELGGSVFWVRYETGIHIKLKSSGVSP